MNFILPDGPPNTVQLRHFKPSFCTERSAVAAIHAAHPYPPPYGFRDFARNDSLDFRLSGNDKEKCLCLHPGCLANQTFCYQ